MTKLSITVPGKVMLSGEYAVLLPGSSALAFALNRYLRVRIEGSDTLTQAVTVTSNLWKSERLITANADHRDMLSAAVAELFIASGGRVEKISVASELCPSYGFGSSSALRLALVFGAYRLTHRHISPAKRRQLAHIAFTMQKEKQEHASGYDVITQLTGGVVRYDNTGGEWPGKVTPLNPTAALPQFVHIFVGGEGAETTSVIRITRAWLQKNDYISRLEHGSAELTAAFSTALLGLNPISEQRLIKAVAEWRKLFITSPFFPVAVREALADVPGLDRNWSYKTSGAGGADAIIVVGLQPFVDAAIFRLKKINWQRIDYAVEEKGLRLQAI